jgi:HSP20 family protein
MKIIKHSSGGEERPLTLRDAMNRLFEESFWDPFGHMSVFQPFSGAVQKFAPSVDISEDEKEMKIVANIPGYDPKNVKVELEKGHLIIQGETEEEKEDRDKRYFRRERACGQFYREIALPPYVDVQHAKCRMKNGTLTVTMPKEKGAEKKHLKIEME